jgi:hypothetical protein
MVSKSLEFESEKPLFAVLVIGGLTSAVFTGVYFLFFFIVEVRLKQIWIYKFLIISNLRFNNEESLGNILSALSALCTMWDVKAEGK